MKNINFVGCGDYYYDYVYTKYQRSVHLEDTVAFVKTTRYSASVFIDDCNSIEVSNISITVSVSFTGLLAINALNSTFTDIKVQVNCNLVCQTDCDHHLTINGMVFYYNYWKEKRNNLKLYVKTNISNFQYRSIGSCLYSSQYAITVLFAHCYNIIFTIQNTTFSNLNDSSALYYYHYKKCTRVVNNKLLIKNLKFCNNVGNSRLKVFYINLDILDFKDYIFHNVGPQLSSIVFRNCQFVNNTNIEAMIFVAPTRAQEITGYVELKQSEFCNNRESHFIKVKSGTVAFWQLTTRIKINNFTMSSNIHHSGNGLISVVNGIIVLEGPIFFSKNTYYQNIIKLYYSMVLCKQYIQFSDNCVRQIISGNGGSHLLITEYTALNISDNTVYMMARYADTFGDTTRFICPIQFYSKKGNFDNNSQAYNCTILLLNNEFIMSKYFPGEGISYKNCQWVDGSAFQTTKPEAVYSNVMTVSNIIVNKTDDRLIPLTICPCKNFNEYNCYCQI